MQPLWYRNAVIYQVDPNLFRDSNGDGWGDLRGVTERLDHLRGLGVTCLWLMPFYASPFRDSGYDISDHLAVDPRFGTLPDIAALLERAEEIGIHVLIELVVHHTSDQHPWFQQARRDRNSPYRDYYVWADEPEETEVEPAFPTIEDDVWTWDEEAGQYYRHAFYAHEPDLNLANPAVRHEVRQILSFWLRLGVSGFRVDAAGLMMERARAADPRDDGFWLLTELRDHVSQRNPNAVLLGEVDVDPKDYVRYFGDNDRLHLLLNFWLNNHLYLALARQDAEPIARALKTQPPRPKHAQYALWLRNHDELNLDKLTAAERDEVMEKFAPAPEMRIYNRGIRRRLPPMLGGDMRMVALTHSILFSLPGTPILRYGEEIGMGDDLSLEERHAVRTTMQWSDERNGGFSPADPDTLRVPVIREGPYRYDEVNVYAQSLTDDSLLSKTGRMIRTRLGLQEIGAGGYEVLDVGCSAVLALWHQSNGVQVLTLANLSPDEVSVRIPETAPDDLVDILVDGPYERPRDHPDTLLLHGHGYRWLRRREDVFR